jgi:hypothetical protein
MRSNKRLSRRSGESRKEPTPIRALVIDGGPGGSSGDGERKRAERADNQRAIGIARVGRFAGSEGEPVWALLRCRQPELYERGRGEHQPGGDQQPGARGDLLFRGDMRAHQRAGERLFGGGELHAGAAAGRADQFHADGDPEIESMSPAQEKRYWRRWNAVARANRWRMAGGRLDEAAELKASEHHVKAGLTALQIANLEHRAVTADDLRHACHVLACGRDMSHKAMSNKQFDALLNYWGDERLVAGLLLEPLDLGSEIHRANPRLKSRERHVYFLKHECLGGYVANESQRIYGTRNWETLRDEELIALSDHMRKRPNALRAGQSEPPVELLLPAEADCPF